MHLSLLGQIVDSEIRAVEHHYPNVKVNKYVVMPNHVHLILQIQQSVPYCGTDKSVPYEIHPRRREPAAKMPLFSTTPSVKK